MIQGNAQDYDQIAKVARVYNSVTDEYDTAYRLKRCIAEDNLIRREILKLSTYGVVDLGCGSGLGYELVDASPSYVGIDISSGMIAKARAKFPRGTWRVADACRTGLASSSYGLIMSLYGCISYVSDLDALFREIRRLIRPYGKYFLVDYTPRCRVRKNALMPPLSSHLWHERTEAEIWLAATRNNLTAEIRSLNRHVDLIPEWMPQWTHNALMRAEWALGTKGGYYTIVRGNGKT